MSHDVHNIYDRKTKELLNLPGGSINIGEHCWIGQNAYIGKNVRLPNNCIIGAFAVVTKSFNEEYCAIAGNPAKIIRRDVEWSF